MALRGVSLGSKTIEYVLELGLVVLGISASFWIENYREALGEHRQEQVYLQGLHQDLVRDSAALVAYIGVQQRRAAACGHLLAAPDLAYLSSDSARTDVYHIAANERFVRHTNTLREMEGSGQFRLLRDSATRQQLLELDNLHEALTRSQDHQRYDLYEHLYPAFFRGLDFPVLLKRPEQRTTLEAQRFGKELQTALRTDRVLTNVLAVVAYNAANTEGFTATLEATTRLLRRIEGQLKKAR